MANIALPTVVKVTEPSPSGNTCWSPTRILNACEVCNRVKYCDFPEAVRGRLALAIDKELKLKASLAVASHQRANLEKEILNEQII